MALIIITYLAGILTILSPCILPILPFVFSKNQGSFWKNGFPLLLGMAVTFSLISSLAIVGGEFVAGLNQWGRYIALAFLALFGLSLIFKETFEKLLAPLTNLGSRLGGNRGKDDIRGSVLVGVGTGFLWAPCAGPILGLVLTGAATQKDIGSSIVLLIAYSLGAATALGLALAGGNQVFGKMKKFLRVDQLVKKIIGVLVLLGVVVIVFNLDRTLLTKVSKYETVSLENKLLGFVGLGKSNSQERKIEGELPEFAPTLVWLNSNPLTKKDLLGKVVIIDFWTYSCINCIRTLPFIKSWYERYKDDGLVVIGMHTPEFPFERSVDNVKQAVSDLGITYPVAVDNEFATWKAFGNNVWPAHYFIDRKGIVRHHHFGEGHYDESEMTIRELLTEDGHRLTEAAPIMQKTEGAGAQKEAVRGLRYSPETYVGYGRAENFAGTPALLPDKSAEYKTRLPLSLNQWGFTGFWKVENHSASLQKAGGKIIFKFIARDLHLVLGGKNIKFKVSLDGHAPGKDHGVDTDEAGSGVINSHRLYQLIRISDDTYKREHLFEIEFLEKDAEAFAFTFG